jgi:hypothetical protein
MCRDCTNIYSGLVGVVGHMTNNEHQKVKDREKKRKYNMFTLEERAMKSAKWNENCRLLNEHVNVDLDTQGHDPDSTYIWVQDDPDHSVEGILFNLQIALYMF